METFIKQKLTKILFFVKAFDHYGWGHLIRTCRLINKIKKKFVCLIFLEGDASALSFVQRKKIKIFFYTTQPIDNVISQVLKSVINLKPNLIVFDILEINDNVLKLLKKETSSKLIAISDLGKENKFADMTITPNPRELWENKNSKSIIGGIEYITFPNYKKKQVKKNFDILINTGGTTTKQTFDLMFPILSKLNDKGITGTYYLGNVENYDPFEKRYRLENINFVNNIISIPKVIDNYKCAFITAGYIRYELAYYKIPILITSIIQHQEKFAKWFDINGIGKDIGPLKNINSVEVAEFIKNFIQKLKHNNHVICKHLNFSKNAHLNYIKLFLELQNNEKIEEINN